MITPNITQSVFGKKISDMTAEEKRKYHRYMRYKRQNKKMPEKKESLSVQIFNKPITKLTEEEKKIYNRVYYRIKLSKLNKKPHYLTTKAYQVSGRRYRDLTKTESNNIYCAYTKKDNYKTQFCYQYFGKRYKDLTKEEKKEFWKIRQKISRDKQRSMSCNQ